MADVESLKFSVKPEEVSADQKLDRMAGMLKVAKDLKWRIAAIEITDRVNTISIKHRLSCFQMPNAVG